MELLVIGLLTGIAVVALIVYALLRMKPENDAAGGQESKRRAAMAMSVTVGAVLGAVLGAAMDNTGSGVAVGVAVGVAIGVTREASLK